MAKTSPRMSAHARVRRGIARTFQINQLFPDLSPLDTLGLAVSERLGSGHDWWRIVGSKPEVDGRGNRASGAIPSHRRDG